MLRSDFVFTGLAAAALVVPGTPALSAQEVTMAGRSTVYAPNGVIATSQPLATSAGLAVLQAGGNAVDAAVTAAAVLNVTEPHMTGMGGDMFAILWLPDDARLVGLNASGRSGRLMTREALLAKGHDEVPGSGAEAITVPGALAGWAALLDAYGTLTLAEALAPAIRIAREGFPVTPIIAADWREEEAKLRRDEGARATYLIDGTRAPRAGEWMANPDLADTFERIAAEGPGVVYGGEIGDRIAEHVRGLGGYLTPEDFAEFPGATWVTPLSARWGAYRLWELPPNGQGIAALEILRLLEPYDLKGMGHNSAEYLHHLIEAKKIAYADLAEWVGDPDHMRVNPEDLLRDDFIAERRALLDPHRAAVRVDPGDLVTSSETIYLSAADGSGLMVSFINSIYSAFGSGVVVPGTGIMLQNRGAGFTMTPDKANTVAPGKRPFHTIIPAFVTRTNASGQDDPWMSYGVMGGAIQPQGHIQVLMNMLVFDMDPQEAIDAARFRHLSGASVALEAPIPHTVVAELEAMGHEVRGGPIGLFGGAQAVIRLPRGWAAASDPRKDGMAAGH